VQSKSVQDIIISNQISPAVDSQGFVHLQDEKQQANASGLQDIPHAVNAAITASVRNDQRSGIQNRCQAVSIAAGRDVAGTITSECAQQQKRRPSNKRLHMTIEF